MLCLPALIYLIIGIIAIFFYFTKYSIGTVLLKTIFILLWTWLLNFICSQGYEVISWILVLLPYIIFAVFMLMLYEHLGSTSTEKYMNSRF